MSAPEKVKPPKMKLPENINLPFFAYAFLSPGSWPTSNWMSSS